MFKNIITLLVILFCAIDCLTPLVVAFELFGYNYQFGLITLSWTAFGIVHTLKEAGWIYFNKSVLLKGLDWIFILSCLAINILWGLKKYPGVSFGVDIDFYLSCFFIFAGVIISFIITYVLKQLTLNET